MIRHVKFVMLLLIVGMLLFVNELLAAPIGIRWEVTNRYRIMKSDNEVERYRQDLAFITTDRAHAGITSPSPAKKLYETHWDRDNGEYDVDYVSDRKRAIKLSVKLPRGVKTESDSCEWKLEDKAGTDHNAKTYHGCAVEHEFELNDERTASIVVTLDIKTIDRGVKNKYSVTQTIQPRDIIIVVLGDSYGSGEGVPDVNFQFTTGALWEDTRCHRSNFSGFNQAIFLLSETNKHASVTPINLTCSGAEIINMPDIPKGDEKDGGLLSPYAGVDPANKDHPVAQQVESAVQALCKKGVNACKDSNDVFIPDLVLLSVGGNDVGFGPFVMDLLEFKYDEICEKKLIGKTPHSTDNWEEYLVLDKFAVMEKNLFSQDKESVGLYPSISIRLRPKAVLAVGYPDPTHNERGEFCSSDVFSRRGNVGFFNIFAKISREEYRCAYEQVLTPLNKTIERKVHEYSLIDPERGWYFLSMDGKTDRTGICAKSDGRYMSTFNWIGASAKKEGGVKGVMHPNIFGHLRYKEALMEGEYSLLVLTNSEQDNTISD